jgi:hypothetical protein
MGPTPLGVYSAVQTHVDIAGQEATLDVGVQMIQLPNKYEDLLWRSDGNNVRPVERWWRRMLDANI